MNTFFLYISETPTGTCSTGFTCKQQWTNYKACQSLAQGNSEIPSFETPLLILASAASPVALVMTMEKMYRENSRDITSVRIITVGHLAGVGGAQSLHIHLILDRKLLSHSSLTL